MPTDREPLSHARALRADILAAPDTWLPRRDILLTWLDAFTLRAEGPRFKLDEEETADLTALDRFLRTRKIPVT